MTLPLSDGPPTLDEAAFCYAPDTPEKAITAHPPFPESAVPAPQFNITSRWPGTLGTPRELTWSFIPDGVIVDGQPNELFSRLDSLFAGHGGRATWIGLFEACFARWATVSGLTYTRIRYAGNDWDDGAAFRSPGSSTRGDIRIAMIVQDGPSNVLAYNYYPSSGGDMVLDRAENWASSSNNFRFMRNVILHEHGHGMGLRHVCPSNRTRLMEPFLTTLFDGPQHDDIRGAQYLYGDSLELNDSIAAATPLGSVAIGQPLTFGALPPPAVSHASLTSIETNGRQDYFRFNADTALGIQVTVTPVGLTYDSSVQNSDASCSSGNIINSLMMANLAFEVIASDGSTVLASVNAAPPGSAESATVLLPAAGVHYLRIFESDNPSQPQMYTIELLVTDCNGNGQSDAIDISTGISDDCDGDLVPDECSTDPAQDVNANRIPDVCERRRGDFDLDGDVDLSDFAHLQTCLLGGAPQLDPQCQDARLDSNSTVDSGDVEIFLRCMAGADVPYDFECN